MTDFTVHTLSLQAEDRSWLLTTNLESLYSVGVTLDITKFVQATHYPNNYIPSGTVLGKVTASGLYGPYDSTASDGRQTATGVLFSSVRVFDPLTYAVQAKIGGAMTVWNAVVSQARMPFNSTNAATGRGYIDAAGITTLTGQILFLP